MELNFGYTCGDIDSQIDSAKSFIIDFAVDLLQDYGLKVDPQQVENDCQFVVSQVSDCFEVLRRINEDMRSAANNQLSEISEQYEDELYRRQNAESDLRYLESEIQNLQTQLYEQREK